MKDEIAAAVVFLTRIVRRNTNLSTEQLAKFSETLALALVERFRNHWYEDKPSKGQAYRCIRLSRNEPRDSVIDKTARDCGIHYNNLNLPAELTLWVDPREVSCRFGERGTVCEVANFAHHTQTDNGNRPLTPAPANNGNLVRCEDSLRADNENNSIPSLHHVPSPPTSPRPINDNLRLVAKPSVLSSSYSTSPSLLQQAFPKNSSQVVFNRNAANMPRIVSRPQNRVWVRQAKPEQYRWVSKSIAARA
ncbi:uncharacterized protein [Diadema antillarum]|uniref:uncharacterized protein n=1 Tax=Diadema antillarum TaxID=105358 RepID=UPI003A84B400